MDHNLKSEYFLTTLMWSSQYIHTANVSEEHIASIYRLKYGVSWFLRNLG
jgi:hypothetical protein